ncbi:MAG: discoidin domain-containing protein, partial [Candidatus Acidiferrales bacterium]
MRYCRDAPTNSSCCGKFRRACLAALALAFALAAPQVFSQDASPNHAERASDASSPQVTTVLVDATPGRETNSFVAGRAFGSSIDVLPEGDVDKVYTDQILKESLSAGWGPITYRNNSELRMAAWHWNSNGIWSEAGQQAGYFTGSKQPLEMLRHSYSYPLPHRGTTRNGGAESGFSRLTDGDPNTYWKSNPYLTSRFTGEDDSLHPQWVIIDLGATERITILKIVWAEPFARKYDVQYWSGEDPITKPTAGVWTLFPQGDITDGKGGVAMLRLSASDVQARFIRIWMTESSNTCDTHGPEDPRNCVGYAIREVYAGNFSNDGALVDLIRHTPDQGQTATYCSSIDPW